ncbi:MAG: dynamin family protein [Actinomycetota bacterium]|nr:dynamin family protein [Actinomycetota bacterium]
MMVTVGQTGVLAALDLLDPLCSGQDRDSLAALRERLRAARLRVLVAGEAKRGKSTLINALLGRPVLPTGVTPLTAAETTVILCGCTERGEDIEVSFADGASSRYPLAALADFGTERGNPGNRRRVAWITVRVDAPILHHGIEIVDTPGTGSVHAHNTAATDLALPTMDAAILVLTADPPISATERDLLRRVAELSVGMFVVLNKADYLDDAGRCEAERFTAGVAAEAMGRPVRVYPLSAQRALSEGGEPGFAEFAADFLAYLDTAGSVDVEQAVSGHVRRIVQLMLDEAAVAGHAARLPTATATGQVDAFSRKLTVVAASRVDAEDRAVAHSRRLLAGLDQAAADASGPLVADLSARLAGLLEKDLAAAGPADIERQGRARLAAMAAESVDAWRLREAGQLEAGLGAIAERLGRELEHELAELREAARDLLGLELALPSQVLRLEPDRRFFYDTAEHVDQAELLAGAIRRWLPGQAGRRVAGERLRGLTPELADRLLGRARADLQYRMAEATRHLLADLRERYRGSTERLDTALQRAASIRAESADECERQLAELGARQDALTVVLSRLA